MADYPFKINIVTKNGTQISHYDADFADSDDTIISASAIVTRINAMATGGSFIDSIEAVAEGSPNYAAAGAQYLSASYTHPNTGSVVFTDTETSTNGGLDYYTFWGTKVCSVLGLPEGIPIYTENFKLSDSSADTTNYISGEIISDNVSIKKGFKLAPQARMRSNLVWDHAFGEGYLQWVSGSTSKMSIGYDNVNDRYEATAPTGSFNRLEAGRVIANVIDQASGVTQQFGPTAGRITIGDGLALYGDDAPTSAGNTSSTYIGTQALVEISAYSASWDDCSVTIGGGTHTKNTKIKKKHHDVWSNSETTSDYTVTLQNKDNTSGAYAGLAFQIENSLNYNEINGAIIVSRANATNGSTVSNMRFFTSNGTTNALTEKMTISPEGNVDITSGVLSIPGFANVSASLAVATGGSGMSNFAVTADGGSDQSITDSQTLDIAGGDGITTAVGAPDTVTINIDAAQTDITSVVNSSLEIGRDADNRIKFGTDNQIIFEVAGGDNVIMKSSGEIEATSLDISGNIANTDGSVVFKRSSAGANSVLNVRQLSTGTIAEFGTDSANNQIVLGVGGHITGSGNIEMTGTGSFAGLEIGGGTFTSASLAAGGSGGGAVSAVSSGANNRIATFSSADALLGETYLTWDGSTLAVGNTNATVGVQGHIKSYGANKVISGSATSTGSFGYVYSAGPIRAEDDVIAYHSSDERLKSNIITIENPIDKVKQLKGVEYEWNGLQSNYPSGSKDSGIIAQDVQKVLPQLVKEKKDGYLGVRHDRLVGLLVESIKEQQEQIDELKKEVEELKNDSS